MTEFGASGELNATSRVQTAFRQSQLRRLVSFTSLSATTTEESTGGGRETAIRVHVMDIATRRLVPHFLGMATLPCTDQACEMILANALLAGWMVEHGWSSDHSQQYATDLLAADGYEIGGL
jgi:hypothetical protein